MRVVLIKCSTQKSHKKDTEKKTPQHIFDEALADETNFTCKPIYAAVQADNGTFYEESLENMDEAAAFLSVVPEWKFSIRKNGIMEWS